MKRKIGELRNIPIVEGDKNLVREGTEIHINDLQSKGSSGGGGGILYLKYNGERHFVSVGANPFTRLLPIIAGVAIYNDGGSRNSIESYYSDELYSFHTTIDFGEMAIPKIECNYGNREFGIEYVLNTNSLENICISMAKMLVDNPDFFLEFLLLLKKRLLK